MDKVETLTVEIVRETINSVQGSYPLVEPYIRYRTFAPSTIDLTIVGHPKALGDRAKLTHELMKNIFKSYTEHGIDIPYPTMDINIKK